MRLRVSSRTALAAVFLVLAPTAFAGLAPSTDALLANDPRFPDPRVEGADAAAAYLDLASQPGFRGAVRIAEHVAGLRLASATGDEAWLLARQLAGIQDLEALADVSASPPQAARPLGEVLVDLADADGVALSDQEREETLRLDAAFPAQVAQGLALHFDAVLRLVRAQHAALARAQAEGAPPPEGMDAFQAALVVADQDPQVRAARLALLAAARALDEAMAAAPQGSAPSATIYGPSLGGTCYLWVIGDALSTTWTDDAVHGVDLGGADVYHSNTGGSTCLPVKPCFTLPGAATTFFTHVDLGLDNDMYGQWSPRRDCGVTGGGHYGAGLLVDQGGNDRYWEGSFGTNGGAYSGVGRLIDVRGDDWYEGLQYGTNGGASVGWGLLLDLAGSDRIGGDGFGTNGGGFGLGAGHYVDLGGSDWFYANDYGVNGGGAASGVGLLIDEGPENDQHHGGSYGVNGGSAYMGVGYLFDRDGSDLYWAGGHGANGGAYESNETDPTGGGLGLKLPLRTVTCRAPLRGFLFDAGGPFADDNYQGTDHGVNGGASGPTQGVAVDLGGVDRFEAADYGTNGGGVFGGHGCLLGLGEGITNPSCVNDTYIAGEWGGNGGAALGGSVGFLYDNHGRELYRTGTYGNGAADSFVALGVLYDVSQTPGNIDVYDDPLVPGVCFDCTLLLKGGGLGFQVDNP